LEIPTNKALTLHQMHSYCADLPSFGLPRYCMTAVVPDQQLAARHLFEGLVKYLRKWMHIALESEDFLVFEIEQNFDRMETLCYNAHRYGEEILLFWPLEK
jgi:hypothetical protein